MYVPSVIRPDTGYLLYVRAGNLIAHPIDPRSWRIRGEARPLVSRVYTFFPTGAAEFSVSNNGLLAYRRYQSRSQLAWVNRTGRVVRTIGPANVNVKYGRLSPDGKKIATSIFDVHRGVFDIWIVDALTGAARRLAPTRGLADSPVWAPDSQRLAFGIAYDAPPRLFLQGIGENDQPEPLPEGFFQIATDWSPDGQFLAFTNTGFAQVQNEMKGDIWLIDMAHERKVVPLIRTPFHEASPAFSPDSRWLAFTSDESGRTEIYLQAFASGEAPRLVGERHLVSRQGVISLRWRRDGRELFYLAQDGQAYAVPVTFSPKLHIGEPSPLFTIALDARAAVHGGSARFDVSPDGQQFLVPIVTSSEKSEIVVMQNWQAALHRNCRQAPKEKASSTLPGASRKHRGETGSRRSADDVSSMINP
jgi:Tol biopolymer transport system component